MYKLNHQSTIKSRTLRSKPSHSDSLKQFKHTNGKLKSPSLEGVKSVDRCYQTKHLSKRIISQEGGSEWHVIFKNTVKSIINNPITSFAPSQEFKSGEEGSGNILVWRPLHREPVLTHSCGVQCRNLTPVQISWSINILDPVSPLHAPSQKNS